MPLDVLGHLIHQVQLHCPEELGVMMRDVPLDRFEELLLRTACELRPALAVRDPRMPFVQRGYSALVNTAWLYLACPTEHVYWCCPGVHARQDEPLALSIRFQNVAAVQTGY
jgi:hypothetical protein